MNSILARYCQHLRLIALPAALAVAIGVSGRPLVGLAAGAVLLLGIVLAAR